MGLFKKATKTESKLRLAIAGPSGSGKTYSALAIATGLGGPIAFVDTEHGSASKYADLFEFDVLELVAPYHPDKYIEAIKGAASAGYKVIILDSMTHAWNGAGGILELVEQATKRQKTPNSYTAWADVTPIQNRLIEAIVSTNIHIIATMRSKQDYVQERNDKGYTTIRKVGMAPIQRDGFEYEFDVFFDMDTDNNAIVSKTRCPELTGKVIAKPGAQVAKTLTEWLHGASVTAKERWEDVDVTDEGSVVGDTQLLKLLDHLNALGEELYAEQWAQVRERNVKRISGGATTSSDKLPTEQLQKLIAGMKKLRSERQNAPVAVAA
jgi:hypothetical protein